jgi:hypothetical protein
MQSTLDLLARALTQKSASDWAREFGVHRATFTNAQKLGHLTPVMAGHLAIALDEDPKEWITVAVIEGEKPSPAKDALARRLDRWRKR